MNNSGKKYHVQMTEMLMLITAVTLLLIVYWFKLDFIIADFIYAQFEWGFKQSFVVEGLLHKFARIMLIALYLGIIYKLIKKVLDAADPAGVYNLFIVILAIGSSVLVVTTVKRLMDVDCPWDLIRYGGDKPFFPLFEYNKLYRPSAHCFPASHASVGFSWIALYFYFKVTQNNIKFKVLAGVLVMGIVFGLAQQLRGAHFISHDLWAFLICLINSIVIYSIAYRSKRPEVFDEKKTQV